MADGIQDREGNSFALVLFLWKKRRQILWITLLGLVAGVIAAYLIRPRYKSQVVLFPAITNSASRALLGQLMTGRDDILALGDEADAEQLLQVLSSDQVRDHTCAMFDLMKVYAVDSNGEHRNTELHEAFLDHVQFEYTKFGSVKVTVMDVEPKRAADMANYITSEVDTVWNGMERQRASIGVKVVEDKLKEIERNILVLNDSLGRLRMAGVQDYHTQSERFNEYLGAAIVKGDDRAVRALDERFKVLAQYGGNYLTLQSQLDDEIGHAAELRSMLTQARADLDNDMPHVFVVDKAQVADKKSYPIRWLLVTMSALSAFVLALLFTTVQESMRKARVEHG